MNATIVHNKIPSCIHIFLLLVVHILYVPDTLLYLLEGIEEALPLVLDPRCGNGDVFITIASNEKECIFTLVLGILNL